jgi:hypothetical protein
VFFENFDDMVCWQAIAKRGRMMLRVDGASKQLVEVKSKTMKEAGYWERRDLQEMICKSPGPFVTELGEYIHLVGSEVVPHNDVADRIDILGVDEEGTAVIIEIKRGSHRLQLLQAVAYAGMVSKWEPSGFATELQNSIIFGGQLSVKPRQEWLRRASD